MVEMTIPDHTLFQALHVNFEGSHQGEFKVPKEMLASPKNH